MTLQNLLTEEMGAILWKSMWESMLDDIAYQNEGRQIFVYIHDRIGNRIAVQVRGHIRRPLKDAYDNR